MRGGDAFASLKCNAPRLTPDELDAILLADERVPFVDPAPERVFVTELLKHNDPRHASPAVRARCKEIKDFNGHDFADWATTVTLDDWEAADSPDTWSRKMMLTSVKNSEKSVDEQILKGHLVDCRHRVHNSARQDVTELHRASLREHGLTVRPVSGTEWRCGWVAEATASLREGYVLLVLLADEKQAYVKTRRPANSAPRHLLIREPDFKWVPAQHRDRIAAQLKRCKRGVLLRLLVYLYGDIEAGFRYEERRNTDFVRAGAEHRAGTSVFQFSDLRVVLPSRRPARCALVAFVDDHLILGHPQVGRTFVALLEKQAEYKKPFRALALGALEPALGIEFTFSPLCATLRISQGNCRRLWVGRFTEIINGRLGERLLNLLTHGLATGCMKAPAGDGVLGDLARSYFSAAMWAARHSVVEMLEPLNHLRSQMAVQWSLNADTSFMHMHRYWQRIF